MIKDKATIRAKREGYKARSVYKLLSINSKYQMIKQNDNVLDLGCWPGSWLQACLKFKARPVGIDLKETKIKDVETLIGDVTKESVLEKLRNYGKFDVVLSDMAPNTTGNIHVDQYKSYELSKRALHVAKKLLKIHGNFVVKIFQGEESNELFRELKINFSFVKLVKPEISKKRSKEIYFVCKNYRG